MKGNIFYAQSGGVTPVINSTAFGLIEHFYKNKKYFGKFFAGKNGILGALNEELIDCLLYTSPSPRDLYRSRMPSSA